MAVKDEEEAPEGAEAPPKKKIGGKKLILIIVAVVVLLAGIGAGLYFTGVIGKKETPVAAGEHGAEGEAAAGEHGEEAAAEEEGGGHGEAGAMHKGPIFAELPQILINLNTAGRRPVYLRVKISLELKNEGDRTKIMDAMPRVIDTFQMYLRELSLEELQGTAGIERLREELRLRVSSSMAPMDVKDVLFTDMIVQ